MIDVKNLKINLESLILNSDKVMIFPHKEPDFDAIAAALGVSLISQKLNKENHIVIGDKIEKVDYGVQSIIEREKNNRSIINLAQYSNVHTLDSLDIICDCNKSERLWVDTFNKDKLAIIDHHCKDEKSFDAFLSHIDVTASSTSEIITALLQEYKIEIPEYIANVLLAGILLDTDRLQNKIDGRTTRSLTALFDAGATMDKANALFWEDIKSDKKVQELLMNSMKLAIVMGDEDKEYSKEDLAKAANKLLKRPVNTSFALGNIGDGVVSISARSKDSVDVSEVMRALDGGGGPCSSATKLKGVTVEEAGNKLMKVLFPKYFIKRS